jgi:hypothetical protein
MTSDAREVAVGTGPTVEDAVRDTDPASGPDLLAIYLNDHLAGATGGVELARRLADAHHSGEEGARLRRLANDVAEDRATLISLMARLDVSVNQVKVGLGWVVEKLGRLKLNGYLVRRSPLSTVVELEAMRLGVEGKAAGWRSLRTVAGSDERIDVAELDGLIERAAAQIEVLEALRVTAVDQTFVRTVDQG